MEVLTLELKNFLQHAACVTPNKIFVNSDFVKVEARKDKTLFTKTNNYIFCEYEYPANNKTEQVFVIPEKMLLGVSEVCNRSSFTIEKDGEATRIIYGDKFSKVAAEDVTRFPSTPAPIENKSDVSMSKRFVDSIQVAAKHISKLPNKTVFSYVHVNEHGIFATDGGYTYYNSVGKGLPEIFFDDNVIGAIASIENMQYLDAGHYDMFLNESLLYAFIKNEYKTFDYLKFISVPANGSFEVRRSDLIDFCMMVEYTSKDEIAIAQLKALDDKYLALMQNDAAYSSENDFKIRYTGQEPAEFRFNAKSFLPILRSLPYENLTFSFMSPHYKLGTKEDLGYIGIISALK